MHTGRHLPYHPPKGVTVFGKILSSIFGLVFLAIGLFILSEALKQARTDIQYAKWIKTPCVVTSARASSDGRSYKLNISYRYSVAGEDFTSSKYSPKETSYNCSSIAKKNKTLEKFKEGAAATCFVNPHRPSEAVLHRGCNDFLPLLFFALLWTGFSLHIITGEWRKPAKRKDNDEGRGPTAQASDRQRDFTQPQRDFTHPPGSPAKRKTAIDRIPILIGALFTGVGIFIFSLLLNQTFKTSGEWGTTEGTVIASRVDSHHSHKHGTSHSPYVSYSYEVDGVSYENDTYSVGSIFKSESAGSIVRRHSPGTKTTVHYNVKNPKESALVVNKKKTLADYVIFIFPCMFIVMGGGVLLAGLKPLFSERTMPWQNAPIAGMRLKRVRDVQGKVFFTILWCSFCLMFTTIWFTQGNVPFSWTWKFWTFDKFFVLIFPLVGVGLIISCIKSAIEGTHFGHYIVEVSADALRPGARLQVTYAFSRPNLNHREITLSICQTATERDDSCGRHAMRYESVEHASEVYATQEPASLRQGSFVCTIPPVVEGSLINWQIVVRHGKIKDAFKLPVKTAPKIAS